MFRFAAPALRSQLRSAAIKPLPTRSFASSYRIAKDSKTLKKGEVDEHARIFDPDSRAGTAAAATSEGNDFAKHRPVDTSARRSSQTDSGSAGQTRTAAATSERTGEVDEHARIFDPDSRAGTAAAATSEGGDFAEHRPVDTSASRSSQTDSGAGEQTRTASATSTPASSSDASTGVDPGYSAPSSSTDPFPMPFSKGVDLNSPSQSDALEDYGAPIRVPGREPGDESREQIIRRLIYQTRKRGILETDLLMSTFASKELWDMPDKEIAEFDKLLDEPDWDIYYWLVDKKPVPDRWRESFETEGRLGARLRKHTKNEEKEVRWMPDEPPVEK